MKEIVSRLRDQDVRFVQVVWVDNANVVRAKMPHVDQLERTGGVVGISAAQQALPVMADAVAPDSGLGPVGEVMLHPDWSTLRVLPYLPGYAQVLSDMRVDDGAWEHCPRQLLRDQVARLERHGLSLKVAFENEFFLLDHGPDGPEPSDDTVFSATSAMNVSGGVVLDIAETLLSQGLEVETYYPESGPGQHELTIRYRDAVAAADAQIAFRETVRGVARANGMVASFLPKIVENAAGSGCHVNMSVWRGDRNVTGDATRDNGLGREAEAFMAGILQHATALCALTIPSHLSYARIRPHFWAGAYAAWGYNNREAALRVFGGGGEPPKRFELKAADATANPYLALGATIAAGLDGLERELELPPEATSDPANLSDDEREAMRIVPLPDRLDRAIEALERDEVLLEALGESRARTYLAVRRAEWEGLKDEAFDDEVALLLERY